MKGSCFSLLILLLTSVFLSINAAPPTVIRQSYQVKSATTDGLNRMSAVAFEVQFDQPMAVSGTSLSHLSQIELSPIELNLFDIYSPLPMSSAGLLGLISLECDGEIFISVPYDDLTLDEQELLPAPSTGDPILGFFNSFHVVGSSNYMVNFPVANDTLSVMLILEDSRECDAYVGCLFAVGLPGRLTDVDFGSCALHFANGYNVLDPSTPTVLHAAASPADTVGSLTLTGFTPKNLSGCNYFDLTPALNDFSQASQLISGVEFVDMQASFWRAASFAFADPIIACQLILETFLDPFTFEGFEMTDRCLLGESEPAFLDDPCCNAQLRWTDSCCSPREMPFSFPSATLLNNSGFLMGQEGCKHRYILKSAITSYLAGLDDNLNPSTGCSASAAEIASPELFDSYFSFVSDCSRFLYSNSFCEDDSECYTYCFGQECQEAFDSGYGGLNHTQCFAAEMQPTVASIVKVALGIPGASYEEFVQAMIDQLWDPNCNDDELTFLVFPLDPSMPFGFDYQLIPEQDCLALQVCHNDINADISDCGAVAHDSVSHMCAQCYGNACFNNYLPDRCTYPGVDVTGCQALGGVFDLNYGFDACTVPDVHSESDCLNPLVCPRQESIDKLPRRGFVKERCSMGICYLPAITSSSGCVGTCANPRFWDADPGICKIPASSASTCSTAGGVWVTPRKWYDSLYDTQASCEAGICGGGGFIFLGTSGADCAQFGSEFSYACSDTCHACSSLLDKVLCTDPTISNACACMSSGGVWVDSLNACVHDLGAKSCVAKGFEVTFQCEDVSFMDCLQCDTPECVFLQCWAETGAACLTNQTCASLGGECTDDIYFVTTTQGSSCDRSLGPDRAPECLTGCVVPWSNTLDVDGSTTCDLTMIPDVADTFYISPLGCISDLVDDPQVCAKAGGYITSASINEDACYRPEWDGCFQSEFQGAFSKKNETTCTACDASWEPSWSWHEPHWVPYAKLPLKWVPVEPFSRFRFEPVMNYTKLGDIVALAAVQRTRLSLQSELQCLVNPLHSLLRLVACECTGLDRDTYNQVCIGSSDGIRSFEVGSSLLCTDAADSVLLGGTLLEYNQTTIPADYGCVTTDITSVPSIQFRTPIQTSLSALSLSAASTKIVDNDYAVIYNQYGRQVGQLLSDGSVIGFAPLIFSEQQVTRSTDQVNDTIRVNNLTVCLPHSPGITISSGPFPVWDLAILVNRTFVPLNIPTSRQFLFGQDRWCGQVEKGASYFAIARVEDWDQPKQLYSDVEKGFIYTLGALFLFACVIVVILIGMTIYIHGLRGFASNIFKGKQLASLILALLLLFSGIRGIWLFLSGSETINNDTSYSLEAVLTDLPIYIFFSLFMLLIFFWAELYHFQFNRKQAVLGKLKIPFLLVNVFIYVFFVIIIIVYSQSTGGSQSTVGLAYKCIVAGIGFVILTSFMIYGTLLVFQATRMGQGLSKNPQFLRMSIITLVCSIASLVQFIFLLLFAFLDIENVVSVLVYLFVVEIIPMYLLLWMFFQPNRLQETLSSSYGNNARSARLRSLPRSFGSSRGNDQNSYTTTRPSHESRPSQDTRPSHDTRSSLDSGN